MADFFEENIDEDKNGVSLYIPSLSPYTRPGQLKHFVILASLGYVERVDMVPKTRKNGSVIQSAYVHFAPRGWNFRNRGSSDAFDHLAAGGSIKIHYEIHGKENFWTAMVSKSKRLSEPPKERSLVKIELTEQDKDKSVED